MNEQEAKNIFDLAAQAPQPASAIDVGTVMGRARARRRNRRLGTAGSIAMAAAVAALAGGAGIVHGRGSVQTAAAPHASFDPRMRYAEFGWLPADMSERTFLSTSDAFQLSAGQSRGGTTEFFSPQVSVTFFPKDHPITFGSFVMAPDIFLTPDCPATEQQTVKASDIAGRPAQWIETPGRTGHCTAKIEQLRWQYAPDSWAVVAIGDAPGILNRAATFRRIATTVRFGERKPFGMPFLATSVPTGLHIDGAGNELGAPGTGKWRFDLNLSPRSHGSGPAKSAVTIEVIPMISVDPHAEFGPPNTTIDGRPGRVNIDGANVGVLVDGLHVQVRVQALGFPESEVLRILRGLSLSTSDPAKWPLNNRR